MVAALQGLKLFQPKPVTERQAGGVNRTNFFTNPGVNAPVNTLEVPGNGTGELQSDYGMDGASGAAYKGINKGIVGAVFDTNRLGIYGF